MLLQLAASLYLQHKAHLLRCNWLIERPHGTRSNMSDLCVNCYKMGCFSIHETYPRRIYMQCCCHFASVLGCFIECVCEILSRACLSVNADSHTLYASRCHQGRRTFSSLNFMIVILNQTCSKQIYMRAQSTYPKPLACPALPEPTPHPHH